MRQFSFFLFSILLTVSYLSAQSLYFPPMTGDTWETQNPSNLAWCAEEIDSLYSLLESGNTKAFILLKDGKIVLEKYFDGHDAGANWQWASAGKTLTAFTVGMIQEEGLLDIYDATADYLGQGWTSCVDSNEQKITIRNQLTMTSGLDDSGNPYCTDSTCLHCIASPNTRWAYHNGPYTLLLDVIENSTGQSFNQVLNTRLKSRIGMQGASLPIGDNRVYFSTARSMARFGLLMLNGGVWESDTLMKDKTYFNAQITPSQTLNESYGYLWWLNGMDSYMLPSLQFVFQGSMTPSAPTDMYAGIGADGQYLCVVPSQNMVVIRQGENPDTSPVPTDFLDAMWAQIQKLPCGMSDTKTTNTAAETLQIYPNPTQSRLFYDFSDAENKAEIQLYSLGGQLMFQGFADGFFDKPNGLRGAYIVHFIRKNERVQRLVFFE